MLHCIGLHMCLQSRALCFPNYRWNKQPRPIMLLAKLKMYWPLLTTMIITSSHEYQ